MDPSLIEKDPMNAPAGRQELRYNEELADFVNKEFERRKTERKPYELQWRLNMEFVNGNQYLDIDTTSMTIMDVPRMYWYQEREVFNQISVISETRIARLSRQKPVMKVRPASNDQGDVGAAKVSSMLLTSTWHDEDMDIKYDKFIAWLETCGTAFFKVVWNKDRGRVLQEGVQEADGQMPMGQNNENTSTPEQTMDPQATDQQAMGPQISQLDPMNPMLQTQAPEPMQSSDPFQSNMNRIVLREGDIETDVASPFEIYPDNSHGDFDDTRSVIHARAYHINDIEDTWGVKVDAEKVDVSTLQENGSGVGGLGYSVGSFKTSTKTLKDYAVVKEYYEIPSTRFPYGRFIVVAGQKTLYAGILPYKNEQDEEPGFPFVRSVSISVVGSFWGKSVIERCIPIQRRYNALRNRKAEYLNLVAVGQWYAPDGVVEDESVLNNEPGNIIRYRNLGNGVRPEPVVYPSLPSSFENEEGTLLQEFTAVSGVSEMSRFSEAPAGVKSGIALSISNEQDDTRISLTTAQLEQASVGLGKQWLRLYRQFAQEPRIIRYVGSNSEIDVLQWVASDLRSDDVIIDNSSALSETPSQRRQMVFDLINTGIFDRPDANRFSSEGVRKILEMLEFGHWESGVNEDEELQQSKAKRENREMLEGLLAPVNEYDNDDLHMREHYRFMMSSDFDEMTKQPEGYMLAELFYQHIALHKQHIQQLQMEQAQQQMQTQMMQQQMMMQAGLQGGAPLEGGDAAKG